ncbi:P-loop containing nucleoside triphosphate hydrolase protein [Mycena galopus ATCC 62051]|nr:P-loop containing nucleoside triphosphate hydrolase protein [Mycena galopus ATCC 62051]
MPSAFQWQSSEGYALARRILKASPLPYDPHDYQIEGICCSLDGMPLLAITPTGSGKTGFYTMYMLVVQAVVKDPTLCPTAAFPADPCLLLICPTIALQLDMAEKMRSVGLSVLAINNNSREKTFQLRNENLWETARQNVNIIIAGPEQLKSDEFEKSLRDEKFDSRICGTGCDEVHLLNTWGRSFRLDFLQMGPLKARMKERHNPWILTTATLRDGPPYQNVLDLLGLTRGRFHLIRRSNLCPDVQILFRTLYSSLDNGIYPELDWILAEGRSTIIFAKYISLGSKIYAYLHAKCPPENRDKRIRLYNSMNFESHNAATRKLLDNPDMAAGCQIVIGTDALSVGVNIPVRQDAIVIGDVDDVDELIQKGGPVGRNQKLVHDARLIVYVTASAIAAAEKAIKAKDLPLPAKTSPPDLSMPEMIVSSCKVEAQNRLYNNPISDPPCTCTTCTSIPPRLPRPACNCSGCISENLTAPAKSAAAPKPIDGIPKRKRLTKLQRAHGTARLLVFQREVWRQADITITSFLTPEVFLSSSLIKTILDVYSIVVSSQTELNQLLEPHKRLDGHHVALFELLQEMKPEFQKIATDRKAELAAARASKKKSKRAEEDEITDTSEEEEPSGAEEENIPR